MLKSEEEENTSTSLHSASVCFVEISFCMFSGVDEVTIIETLVRRSNAQRQQIKAAYQQANGKVSHSLDLK